MSYVLLRDGSPQPSDEFPTAESQIADPRTFLHEELVGDAALAGAGNVLASM
jgi:hypothetical protein